MLLLSWLLLNLSLSLRSSFCPPSLYHTMKCRLWFKTHSTLNNDTSSSLEGQDRKSSWSLFPLFLLKCFLKVDLQENQFSWHTINIWKYFVHFILKHSSLYLFFSSPVKWKRRPNEMTRSSRIGFGWRRRGKRYREKRFYTLIPYYLYLLNSSQLLSTLLSFDWFTRTSSLDVKNERGRITLRTDCWL